jgi:hypothetical protein
MKPKNKAAQALAKLSHAGPPSEARKSAARENGKRGGRPRKTTTADCERPDLCILAPDTSPAESARTSSRPIPVSKPALAGGLFCVRKLAEQIEACYLAGRLVRSAIPVAQR